MSRHLLASVFLSVVACVSWTSCSGGDGGAAAERPVLAEAKPRALGDVNRLVIVADQDLLSTAVGDSIAYHYEQPYPLMPQPEPLYDLRYMVADDLKQYSTRRELRSYVILADLLDPSSPTTKFVAGMLGEEKLLAAREDFRKGTTVVVDQWANGQVVVYLYAEGPERLAELVAKSFKAANRRIQESDREVLMANIYQSGRNPRIVDSLKELVGIGFDVPQDYAVAKAEPGFMWLRRDLQDVVQNILVGEVPYRGPQQLTVDSAVAYRNRISRDAVRTNTEGSVMSTNDRDLPVVEQRVEIKGQEVLAAKGVWEMTDDYMGGPFFTYLIPDEAAGKLYVVDAFVYAPGSKKGKRNYMQQLETIVETAE